MTSSMIAGERRWASARGGMTVLGKVAVPKPLNLPSQRLENHGMDPSVEIIPKGTLSWGSRPSSSTSNPWGSSTLSPKADGGASSPSHPSGRLSSGSGTRPSSSCSDRTHEINSVGWGPSSRPSSASGSLASNHNHVLDPRVEIVPKMRTLEFMDMQITDLSRSKSEDSFNFFTHDNDIDDDFACDPSLGASLSPPATLANRNSKDHVDSGKFSKKEVQLALASEISQTIAGLTSEISQTMKEHFDNLLRSVDGLSARLSQMESKMSKLENAVDNLNISSEYNNDRKDGKLRQLESILREVQDGVLFLKDLDKQEITEALLQLAKLQGSKSYPQSEDPKTAGQSESAHASEQSPRPALVSGSFSHTLPTVIADASSTLHYQNATLAGAPIVAPVHSQSTQSLQNPIPSCCAPSESCYFPSEKPLETTYQQYNVSPNHELRPPPPAPPHFYEPALNLPQSMGESTQGLQFHPSLHEQFHPSLHEVNRQNLHSRTSYHPEGAPPLPHHNYSPIIHRSSSLSADGPTIHHQLSMDSSQQMHGQPLKGPNSEFPSGYFRTPGYAHFGNMNACNGSSSHYSSSTMNRWEISPSSSVQSGGSVYYTGPPKAQILPHALPTASNVDTGSSSGGGGNKAPVDDVVDRVTAMGFRRDLVRATVMKLTQNGQSMDLNVVLDKLMNDGNV